jgi:predicted transposase YbfD/YdcC
LRQLSRDHWQIENGLFHVRDVTFGEDASRVRSGSAPQTMAELRNASLTFMHMLRAQAALRTQRETFAARPWAAIRDSHDCMN